MGIAVGVLAAVGVGLSMTGSFAVQPMPFRARVISSSPVSSKPPLRVVAFGDSVPAASNCDCTSYVQTVADQLAQERGRSAQAVNLAVGGYATSDVLSQFDDADTRRQAAGADVVLIEVGANDFDEGQVYDSNCADAPKSGCFNPTMSTMSSNLSKIVNDVKGLDPHARIVLVGYWNVFRDGQIGALEGATYVGASDSLTRWVNSSIQSIAAAQGAQYADVYTAMKGADGTADVTRYLVDDGDHPNEAGHTVIAKTVVAAVDR